MRNLAQKSLLKAIFLFHSMIFSSNVLVTLSPWQGPNCQSLTFIIQWKFVRVKTEINRNLYACAMCGSKYTLLNGIFDEKWFCFTRSQRESDINWSHDVCTLPIFLFSSFMISQRTVYYKHKHTNIIVCHHFCWSFFAKICKWNYGFNFIADVETKHPQFVTAFW